MRRRKESPDDLGVDLKTTQDMLRHHTVVGEALIRPVELLIQQPRFVGLHGRFQHPRREFQTST